MQTSKGATNAISVAALTYNKWVDVPVHVQVLQIPEEHALSSRDYSKRVGIACL